jgi:hypothetical protein
MRSIAMLGALAVFAAAPLSAQGNFRTGGIDPARRVPSTGGVLGTILGRDTTIESRSGKRNSDHIPPGQLPPAGMCRIWIDGVPPGQQPAPTDCQTAVATKPANARVIWGDQSAFPGKGKGKFKQGKGKHDRVNDDRDDDDRELGRAVTRGKAGATAGNSKSVAKRGKKG